VKALKLKAELQRERTFLKGSVLNAVGDLMREVPVFLPTDAPRANGQFQAHFQTSQQL
jgi:hypothetical protein